VQDAGGNTVTTDTSSVTSRSGPIPAKDPDLHDEPAGGHCRRRELRRLQDQQPPDGLHTDGHRRIAHLDDSASFDVTPPPLWVANGATTTWTDNTAATVALPASLNVNDLELLIVRQHDQQHRRHPTGWTSVGAAGSALGAGVRLSVFRKVLCERRYGAERHPQHGHRRRLGEIVAFRYVNTTTPAGRDAATSTSAAGAATFTQSRPDHRDHKCTGGVDRRRE